jgi:hypothetical protein
VILEVEQLEDRSMLSGVSFVQMPPIDSHAGAVLNDYGRWPGPPQALALADLNGDGRVDIITIGPNTSTNRYYPSHQLVWYENKGGAIPTFTLHALSIVPSSPGDIIDVTSVTALEVDGDSRVDLVITYTDTDPYSFSDRAPLPSVAWLQNTSNPSTPLVPHFIGSLGWGPHVIGIQDVNGAGRPDIVVAGYTR